MPANIIVLSALDADFWSLTRLLGPFIVVGIILAATLSLLLPSHEGERLRATTEMNRGVSFLFVSARSTPSLSDSSGSRGVRPVAQGLSQNWLPSEVLFWFNSLSAVFVNATLAAVEIGLSIGHQEQRSLMLGC
jgi:predicted cation transporter